MSLDDTIALHRNLYRDDLFIDRLVQRQPPTSLDLNTGVLDQEPAAAIGMTISGRLLRYVGHPEGYGSDFPWSKALYRLRFHCRKRHLDHRAADRPYWRGSLCWQAVHLTVVRNFGPVPASQILRISNLEDVLLGIENDKGQRTGGALGFIESAMDDYRERSERRQRDDEGRGPGAVPAPRSEQRHDQPGMHRDDCPQCKAA